MDKELDCMVFKEKGLDGRRMGLRGSRRRCPILCALLTGVILKRLTLRSSVFDVCVYVLFCELTCERVLYL